MSAPHGAVAVHPRDLNWESWRGKIAAYGSRGEVDGPRVDEATAALKWHRDRKNLLDMGMSETDAEALLELLREDPSRDGAQ